jgi:hypothetical protein
VDGDGGRRTVDGDAERLAYYEGEKAKLSLV